jgi:hypothetical protein
VVAARVGERRRVDVREPLGERSAQLAAAVRPVTQQLPRHGQHRAEIDALEVRRELGVAAQLGVEHRLRERAQQQGVIGRDEVDGAPHDDDPHQLATDEGLRDVVGFEALEPRPQRDVRVTGHLGLQPDEVVDGVVHRHRHSPEEQLAGERRPAEGARRQHLGGHGQKSVG